MMMLCCCDFLWLWMMQQQATLVFGFWGKTTEGVTWGGCLAGKPTSFVGFFLGTPKNTRHPLRWTAMISPTQIQYSMVQQNILCVVSTSTHPIGTRRKQRSSGTCKKKKSAKTQQLVRARTKMMDANRIVTTKYVFNGAPKWRCPKTLLCFTETSTQEQLCALCGSTPQAKNEI